MLTDADDSNEIVEMRNKAENVQSGIRRIWERCSESRHIKMDGNNMIAIFEQPS